ncbi:MAG: polyprenyl synthetase family protein [Treponema sp.]|jgi:octaprenyl-diphosphate synthase|nr:polyprenyl synthetase family protein [Treponema sp.]
MTIEYTRRLEKIESVLNSALPLSADPDWMRGTFSSLPSAVRSGHVAPLVESCADLFHRGGKRWRPLLMVLACELGGGGERAYALTPVVEFSHTASLIHDDIEDHADERRGKPAVHLLFGEDTAINAASWLYFHAQSVIEAFPASDALKLLLFKTASRELRRLHLGQAMDIAWHRNPSLVPVRAEYEAMVTLKTGTLSRLAGEIGMLAAGKDESTAAAFGDLSARVGVGFQVLDDVRNLTTGNPGKNRGDDVVEGKKSLPVILHLEKNPKDLTQISAAFIRARHEGPDSSAVEEVIGLLTASGAIEEARSYGVRLIEQTSLSLRGRYPEAPAAELICGLFDSMLSGLS